MSTWSTWAASLFVENGVSISPENSFLTTRLSRCWASGTTALVCPSPRNGLRSCGISHFQTSWRASSDTLAQQSSFGTWSPTTPSWRRCCLSARRLSWPRAAKTGRLNRARPVMRKAYCHWTYFAPTEAEKLFFKRPNHWKGNENELTRCIRDNLVGNEDLRVRTWEPGSNASSSPAACICTGL